MDIKFEFYDNGEIRMGCEGYGVSIINNGFAIDILKNDYVFIGESPDETEKYIAKSSDEKYFIIKGEFFTYISDSSNNSFSLYKATIRNDTGIWNKETPIFGKKTYHIDGQDGQHYYLQFPFIDYKSFKDTFKKYHSLRIKQIMELKNI